jgi:hypothetical protein
MTKSIPAFVIGFIVALALFAVPVASAARGLPVPAVHREALPTAEPTASPSPTPQPTAVMQPAVNPVTAGIRLGLENQVQCWNCAPFSQKVLVTHYDPMSGPDNCWDFDEQMQYCFSPTQPGIRWKGIWGLGAACAVSWPFGTWVVIPDAGAFICLDRGGGIVCTPEFCNVDILGPSGPWDGKIVTATLWVPLDPPREKVKP